MEPAPVRTAKRGGARPWARLLPLCAAALIGSVGSALWWQAARVPREALRLETEVVADQLASRLSAWVEARLAIVEHFRQAWPKSYQHSEQAFRHDARLFVGRFPGFRAFNWIDPAWVIRVTVPERGNERALNRDLHEHPAPGVRPAIERALASGRITRTEAAIPFLQGGRGFATYAPIVGHGGRPLGFINAVFDMRQLVDRALPDPRLRERFRFCLSEEGGAVTYASHAENVDSWSLRAERTFAVVDRPWRMGVGPAPDFLAATSPWRQVPLLGGIWLLALAVAVLLQAAGRRQAQTRALVDSVGHGVFGLDLAGRCTWANAEALRRLGFDRLSDVRGKPLHALIHHSRPDGSPYPEEHCPVVRARRNGARASGEDERLWTRDGSSFPVEYRVAPVLSGGQPRGAVVSFSDIAERRRAEEERSALELQMQKAQKLESLGLMAGGIAHDFNNLLVGILGTADALRSELPGTAPARAGLEGIRAAARKASGLCRQLLAYSGGGRFPRRPCDLNCVIDEMTTLVEMSMPKSASLRIDLAEWLPAVRGDSSQICQVVMNLIGNAAEALGPEGGEIRVRTSVEARGENDLWELYSNESLPAGDYVLLEVGDDGSGMDEETLARIFEPFFTTKFIGRGLGLAATLGIVRGHGGAIEVRSQPGCGSTFRVWLPSLGCPAQNDASEASADVEPGPLGPLTVLLVDDEDTVRRAAGRMLERLGHEPLVASSGSEALEVLQGRRGDVACAILDLTMPGLSGSDLLRALREIRPELPVLVSSGYAEQDVLARFEPGTAVDFLAKPYDLAQLRQTLARALSAS